MKKNYIILLVIAIVIIVVIGAIVILNKANSDNQTITVTTNGGVPYSWEYDLSDNTVISIEQSSKSLNKNEGGTINVYFKVIPKKEGSTTLTLNYKNIQDKTIEETKKYDITVNKDLKVTIKEK